MKNKILGSLYASAIGDAMGAPTELRSTAQIKEKFGGYVKTFLETPQDTFARGYPIGTVTDDFSMSYYIMKSIIDNNGQFDEDAGKKAITNWGDDDVYFENFAGPTTRAAIENIKQGLPTDVDPYGLVNYNMKATNGGAMKATALGILANGDYDKAVNYAYYMCKPTHFNSSAIAGAAAISAAVTEAMKPSTTLDKIYEAGIYGAKQGRLIGERENHISVGPDIAYKIGEAVKVGQSAKDFDQLLEFVSDRVGANINVAESVPAVFALIAGVKGDLMEGIYAAVNVGSDTDTIASMLGGILGALHGVDHVPADHIQTIIKANPTLDIENVVNQFADVCMQS